MSPLKDEILDKRPKEEDCSVDFRVLAKLYEYIEIKKQQIWFSKLVSCFEGKIPKVEISKSEDKLYDLGIIDKKYQRAEGLWTSCYIIEDEAMDFAKTLYESFTRK
jgi:hypothetical protein